MSWTPVANIRTLSFPRVVTFRRCPNGKTLTHSLRQPTSFTADNRHKKQILDPTRKSLSLFGWGRCFFEHIYFNIQLLITALNIKTEKYIIYIYLFERIFSIMTISFLSKIMSVNKNKQYVTIPIKSGIDNKL